MTRCNILICTILFHVWLSGDKNGGMVILSFWLHFFSIINGEPLTLNKKIKLTVSMFILFCIIV